MGMAELKLVPILAAPTILAGCLLHYLNLTEPHDPWILDELNVSGLLVLDIAESIHKGTTWVVAHFDYLQVIRKNFTTSLLNWKGQHVRGQQDRWKYHDKLDWWEQTNACMVLGAKSKMSQPSYSDYPPYLKSRRLVFMAE
jgi:hypothetical protein